MCIDDMECKKVLQVLTEERGREILVKRYGVDSGLMEKLGALFGISGLCNILGAIKTAKHYRYGKDDVIVTVATDSLDRYHSVMDDMAEQYGHVDEAMAAARIEGILMGQRTDWIMDGTREARTRWHNLKYYTWVEQQGKTVEELDAQRDPAWWETHQQMVQEIDSRLTHLREANTAKA